VWGRGVAAYGSVYLVVGLALLAASRAVGAPGFVLVGVAASLALLAKSPDLALILAMVLLTQMSITLLDYAYNDVLAATYSDTELTQAFSWVYAATDATALALQLATAPVLRLAGVPATLLALPLLLGSAITTAALVPRALVFALAKIAAKSLDYSLFRAAKEILYIPLSYAEKTRGKALIDMLVYRVSKVGASLVLGGFVLAGLGGAAVWIALGLVALWLLASWLIARRYRERVSREEELEG